MKYPRTTGTGSTFTTRGTSEQDRATRRGSSGCYEARFERLLRGEVRAVAKRLGLNAHDVALYTDLAWSTVGRYLAGDYSETSRIREQMERFLGRVKRGEIQGKRQENVVQITAGRRASRRPAQRKRRTYETEMVRRVWSAIDLSVENGSLGLVTADNGCGKTHAVQLWRVRHRDLDSVYFEFDDCTISNRYEFLTALASQLGVEERASHLSSGRIFRQVVERLREEPAVLIFDQCEMARVRILQIVRQIWDRTREEGVAVVLLATPQLLWRLERGRAGDLGALRSRIGAWVQLHGVRREEMAGILKAEGLTTVNDAAFDLWYRAINGSMRHLMESIDLLVSRHKGKKIGQRTVIDVCRSLMGISIAGNGGRLREAELEGGQSGAAGA